MLWNSEKSELPCDISEEFSWFVLANDNQIHIATRAFVVCLASNDGVSEQFFGFCLLIFSKNLILSRFTRELLAIYRHVFLETGLENGGSWVASGAHCGERQIAPTEPNKPILWAFRRLGFLLSMGIDHGQTGSIHVNTPNDQMDSNVPLVLEKVVGDPSTSQAHLRLSACVQPDQLQLSSHSIFLLHSSIQTKITSTQWVKEEMMELIQLEQASGYLSGGEDQPQFQHQQHRYLEPLGGVFGSFSQRLRIPQWLWYRRPKQLRPVLVSPKEEQRRR